MGDNIDYDKFAEIFAKQMERVGFKSGSTESLVDWIEKLKQSTKLFKEHNSVSKSIIATINGQNQAMLDVRDRVKEFDEAIEKATIAEKYATTATEKGIAAEAKQQAQSAKNELIKTAVTKNATNAMGNLVVGIGGAIGTMISGAFIFANGLIANKSANDLYAASLKNRIDTEKQLTQAMGGMASDLGQTLGMLGAMLPGWWKLLALIGPALEIFGVATKQVADKTAELAKQGLDVLNDQLNKVKNSFGNITSIGGILTGGMTELNAVAVGAGMDILKFSEGIKSAKDSIDAMGMTTNDAILKIANVTRVLRNTNFGIQLDKLGYSMQEQIGLQADVMAQLRLSNDKRIRSDGEVAEMTVQYGKDLKILQNITGGQAREALKKARQEVTTAQFLAASSRYGGDAAEKFIKMIPIIDSMGPDVSEAIKQMLTTIDETTTNAAGAYLLQTRPELQAFYEALRGFASDTNKHAADVYSSLSNVHKAALQENKNLIANQKERGLVDAATLSNSGVAKDIVNNMNAQYKTLTDMGDEGLQKFVSQVDAMATTTNQLDQNIADSAEAVERITTQFNSNMFPRLVTFTNRLGDISGIMKTYSDAMHAALVKLGLATEGPKVPPPKQYKPYGEQRSTTQTLLMMGTDEGGSALSALVAGASPNTVSPLLGGQQGGGSEQAIEKLIKFNGGVTGNRSNFNDLESSTREDFIAMLQEANLGRPVNFTSGMRSPEEQAQINSGGRPKAEPGKSFHQDGRAIDIDHADLAQLAAIPGLLQKYHFLQIPGDDVHLQHPGGYKKYRDGSPQTPEDGIAGEAGPEFVSAGAHVTSAAETKAIFVAMSEQLGKLLSAMEKNNGLAQKQLLAMS